MGDNFFWRLLEEEVGGRGEGGREGGEAQPEERVRLLLLLPLAGEDGGGLLRGSGGEGACKYLIGEGMVEW